MRETEDTTPTIFSRSLSKRFSRRVYLKLESLSPIRSFKHRGALVTARDLQLSGCSTVVTASTGNHGQGFAYASAQLGMSVTVVLPESVLPEKLSAVQALGANVEIAGSNLSEAQQVAEQLAVEWDTVYVEDGEDPGLMAGAATVLGEMVEQAPDLDCVLVPIGGGNLISGSLLTRLARGISTEIVGVQSSAAPGATASWLAERLLEREAKTFAGGLATERPGALALSVMNPHLSTLALVEDDDLYNGMAVSYRETGCLMEGAAAAPIAALERFSQEIDADCVGIIVTGNWLSRAHVLRALGQ